MHRSLHNELDLLDIAQQDAEQRADAMNFASDVDRRQFVFFSLATAAASTFGLGAKALAQTAGASRRMRVERRNRLFPRYRWTTWRAWRGRFNHIPAARVHCWKRPTTRKVSRRSSVSHSPLERRHQVLLLLILGAQRHFPPVMKTLRSSRTSIVCRHQVWQDHVDATDAHLSRSPQEYDSTLLFMVTIMETQGMADAAKMDAELKARKIPRPTARHSVGCERFVCRQRHTNHVGICRLQDARH